MEKFLEQVADAILQNGENNIHTAVIFPNKRSEIFLKNIIKAKSQSSIWLPDFFTIDEFINQSSGMVSIDPILVYFELYEIHKEIEGDDARSLEDFLNWAPLMLADFNDIDLNLTDAKQVFQHLSEAKAISEWNLDRKPLTEMQQNYLAFFNSLILYYKALSERMDQKKSGYKGMIYRRLSENISDLASKWKYKDFICVGFNALSRCEKDIFSFVNKNYNTRYFWDVDDWYMRPKAYGLEYAEAGRFINGLFKDWKFGPVVWPESKLASTAKNIQLIGIPKRIGQVKYVGQQLLEWQKYGHSIGTDTAVVLADESMLIPLLNSLAEKDNQEQKLSYNVSMGLGLSTSPLAQFANQWIDFLLRFADGNHKKFNMVLFQAFINNTLIRFCLSHTNKNTSKQILHKLKAAKSTYFTKAEFFSYIKEILSEEAKSILDLLLIESSDANQFIAKFLDLMVFFKKAITASGKQQLLEEQLLEMTHLLKKISNYFNYNNQNLGLAVFQKILSQLLKRSEISLKGEPLRGIQIMGMLETRNLDFKNLIIVSANEGILPKKETMDSFIPYDIRSYYNLPLPKDHADVFSYYFYRLLQGSENICLLYNTESDVLGGGEQSRYILQLKNELATYNKKINLQENFVQIALGSKNPEQEIIIDKNSDIMERLENLSKTGFSASSINSYVNCKLQFYFSRLLHLKPSDSFESLVEADTFGSIVHAVLEDIYSPFLNKEIKPESLKESLKKLDLLLGKRFEEYVNPDDLRWGKNLLIVSVAKQYVQQFVSSDIRDLKKKPRILLGLEMRLSHSLDLNGRKIQLKGFFDRVDRLVSGGKVRIVDYKTGKVAPNDIRLKDWAELATTTKQNKTFQLLLYAYLYAQLDPLADTPDTGIFSLRSFRMGYMIPELPEKMNMKEGLEQFEVQLKGILTEIFDPTETFTKTEDETTCSYCHFKNICNR